MPKTYVFTVNDDAAAADFEAGLASAGYTPQSLFAKEVFDFAKAKRSADAEAQKPPVTDPDVTVDAEIDGLPQPSVSLGLNAEATP